MKRRNPTRLLGAERINKHTKRKLHRKHLMQDAKGSTIRRNARIKRGEEPVPGAIIHTHCGCGSSGCCFNYIIESKGKAELKKQKKGTPTVIDRAEESRLNHHFRSRP